MIWNDDWNFIKASWEELDPNVLQPEGEPVCLPHTWYEDGVYYRGDAAYQKAFDWQGKGEQRIFIRFHGVDKVCRVYLNGSLAGTHEGGYSIFCLELTPYLRQEGGNLLTVLVNNEAGKTVSPLSGDFTCFGGIYRKVELLVKNPAHFDCTYYGTEGVIMQTRMQGDDGYLYLEPHVAGVDKTGYVRYTVYGPEGRIVCQEEGETDDKAILKIPHPACWNGRKQPVLYTVKAEILADGQVKDTVEQKVGFQTAVFDAEQGFFLNGSHMKLKGVAKHQDTAEVFSAASMEHWERDMELIEEIGANAVRLSHYQHPQEFYQLCDERGMVVWAEIPLLKLTEDEKLFENAKEQLKELILQNMHHPSICMWGLQNEIAIFGEKPFMYDKMKSLQAYAKELDSTRYTTSANLNSVGLDSPLNRITDIVAYNWYYGWYYGEMDDFDRELDRFHQMNPDVPLGISEYGVDCNVKFHSQEPKVKDYTEEFQAKFHETVYPKLEQRPFVWGSFVWNMFDFVSGIRDEGGVKYRNNKGLVTHDRKIKKDSFYYYKAVWSKEPFVQIAEQRFRYRSGETMDVKVYSNCRRVILEAAGKSLEQESDTGVFVFTKVPLAMGENPMTARAGEYSSQAVFVRREDPETSYVFVDENPGLNVKNWFEDEVEREKLFPEGCYSILDTIETLRESREAMEQINSFLPCLGEWMQEAIGTFTLEQSFIHEKTLCTEDEIKTLNARLITVKKHNNL